MTRTLGRFLRHNTIGLLALFVALGGTTYAATALPKNSVGAKQLKKNAVVNAKIAPNAVTAGKVKNDALTGADVLESSLAKVPAAATADSATSATNATNATNATTAANAGTVGGNTVKTFVATVAPGAAAANALDLGGLLLTLSCPAGAVNFVVNNDSGTAAAARWDAQYGAGTANDNGISNLTATSNLSLVFGQNIGSGSVHFVRADGKVVSATYGWRNDGLGGTTACRVFGYAVSS